MREATSVEYQKQAEENLSTYTMTQADLAQLLSEEEIQDSRDRLIEMSDRQEGLPVSLSSLQDQLVSADLLQMDSIGRGESMRIEFPSGEYCKVVLTNEGAVHFCYKGNKVDIDKILVEVNTITTIFKGRPSFLLGKETRKTQERLKRITEVGIQTRDLGEILDAQDTLYFTYILVENDTLPVTYKSSFGYSSSVPAAPVVEQDSFAYRIPLMKQTLQEILELGIKEMGKDSLSTVTVSKDSLHVPIAHLLNLEEGIGPETKKFLNGSLRAVQLDLQFTPESNLSRRAK